MVKSAREIERLKAVIKSKSLYCYLLGILLLFAPGTALAETYTYDAAGRLTNVTYDDGTSITYTYDNNGNILTIGDAPPGGGGGGGGSGGGGCFIATAAYGSYLDPHVQVLRDFRNNVLILYRPGQAFVAFYNEYSPPVAQFIHEHEAARTLTRWSLTPVVFGIQYPSLPLSLMILVMGMLVLRSVKRNKK